MTARLGAVTAILGLSVVIAGAGAGAGARGAGAADLHGDIPAPARSAPTDPTSSAPTSRPPSPSGLIGPSWAATHASDGEPAAGGTTSGVPGGIVAWQYTILGAPADGLTEMTFESQMNVDPGDASYFWANQASFEGSPTSAFYIGLQPWGTGIDGQSQREALFSVFGAGVTSTSSSCVDGADGGPGVSCRLAYPFQAKIKYVLQVVGSGSTWTGTVTDTKSHLTSTIGSFTTPGAWGLLQPVAGGFTEYFASVPSCKALPVAKETNYPLSASGGIAGPITDTYTYGSDGPAPYIDCSAYAVARLLNGGKETNRER